MAVSRVPYALLDFPAEDRVAADRASTPEGVPRRSPSPTATIAGRINAAGGFLMVPKRTMDFWLPLLNDAEWRLLQWSLYQTIGWNVESTADRINAADNSRGVYFTVENIAAATGLHRNSIVAARRVLSGLGLVDFDTVGHAKWYVVRINLDAVLAQNLCNSEELAQKMCTLRLHKKCAGIVPKLPNSCATPPRINKVLEIKKEREPSPQFLEFFTEYISSTGIAWNEYDQRDAEEAWTDLSLEEQIGATNFVPKLIDDRPPDRYPHPKNYLRKRHWTRTSTPEKPGQQTCQHCRNTGRSDNPHPHRPAMQEPCRHCEAGKEMARKDVSAMSSQWEKADEQRREELGPQISAFAKEWGVPWIYA